MEYIAILTPEPEGGYTISMPEFPEYVGFASTEEEAIELVREGIAFELERLREAGQQPRPDAGPPLILRVAA